MRLEAVRQFYLLYSQLVGHLSLVTLQSRGVLLPLPYWKEGEWITKS